MNKDKTDRFFPTLLQGMSKGVVGGYLVYESKNLVGRIAAEENLIYSWPAKVLNSAGISIIENAALNKPIWSQYNLNIGFNRLEFHFEDGFKFKYQIYPAALIGTAYATQRGKFELERTLKSGVFMFSERETGTTSTGSQSLGYAVGTAIMIKTSELENYRTISHEIIHVYQYHDYNFINSYMQPVFSYFNENYKFFNFLDKIFYYDVQQPFRILLYQIEANNADTYYDNFIEHEANFYSTKHQD
ncbi:hypothetical protein [Autumnicola musiva]|uniref:Uncharacterized protein n=1 Tax=Autumnicola musiva TaxID=3075589 RepID=A0ABU3D7B3_9FLAO|nr:hypothetical protein [Zunongwangia sp. F117]MDT0676893.1 hypothetical protein [Zunongwangia sp. F117]